MVTAMKMNYHRTRDNTDRIDIVRSSYRSSSLNRTSYHLNDRLHAIAGYRKVRPRTTEAHACIIKLVRWTRDVNFT